MRFIPIKGFADLRLKFYQIINRIVSENSY